MMQRTVDPNGLGRSLKRHIDHAHSTLGRDVHVRIERFNKKSQNVFLACPTKAPQQRRGPYGQGRSTSPKQTDQEEMTASKKRTSESLNEGNPPP